MSIYWNLPGGRKLFIEYARWASEDRVFALRRENREILVWLGRWQLIYTPAHWSPVPGDMLNGRHRPI